MKITATIEIERQHVGAQYPTDDSIWNAAINGQNAIDAVLTNGVILNLESIHDTPRPNHIATRTIKVHLQFQAANFDLSNLGVRHLPGRKIMKKTKTVDRFWIVMRLDGTTRFDSHKEAVEDAKNKAGKQDVHEAYPVYVLEVTDAFARGDAPVNELRVETPAQEAPAREDDG